MANDDKSGLVGASSGLIKAAGTRDPFLALLIVGMMGVLGWLLYKQDQKDEKYAYIQTEMLLDQQKKTGQIRKLKDTMRESNEISRKTAIHLEQLVGLNVKRFETDDKLIMKIVEELRKDRDTQAKQQR